MSHNPLHNTNETLWLIQSSFDRLTQYTQSFVCLFHHETGWINHFPATWCVLPLVPVPCTIVRICLEESYSEPETFVLEIYSTWHENAKKKKKGRFKQDVIMMTSSWYMEGTLPWTSFDVQVRAGKGLNYIFYKNYIHYQITPENLRKVRRGT